jgi:hypothetical protein
MKDIDFDSIGKKLKEIRTHKGFTQKFVASSDQPPPVLS